MYNGYNSNVLKSYQINMGIPYQVKVKQREMVIAEDTEKEPSAVAVNQPSADEILESARKEAEKIIYEAKRKADLILKSANEEAAARIREAEEKAKQEGYKQGEFLARQRYQGLINEAEELKQKARELHDNTISGLESEIVELIIETSKKVVGTELLQNRDVILGLIRNAISATSPTERITICVCADDYDYVYDNKDRILEGIKGIRGFEIVKDNSLKKGECIVDTGLGTVDSSIEIQLQAVESTLREMLGQYEKEEFTVTEEENQ